MSILEHVSFTEWRTAREIDRLRRIALKTPNQTPDGSTIHYDLRLLLQQGLIEADGRGWRDKNGAVKKYRRIDNAG